MKKFVECQRKCPSENITVASGETLLAPSEKCMEKCKGLFEGDLGNPFGPTGSPFEGNPGHGGMHNEILKKLMERRMRECQKKCHDGPVECMDKCMGDKPDLDFGKLEGIVKAIMKNVMEKKMLECQGKCPDGSPQSCMGGCMGQKPGFDFDKPQQEKILEELKKDLKK